MPTGPVAAEGVGHGNVATAKAPPPPESTRDDLNARLGESVVDVPITVTGYEDRTRSGNMIVTIYRPKGDGPFPVMVFNHGRDPTRRAETDRFREGLMASYFQRRGIVLMVPTRLGYGATGLEPDIEEAGDCADSDFLPTSQVVARSAFAVVDYARSLPYVDPRRILIGGISAGGLGSIRAAGLEQPPGVIGYVNLAGGLGGNPRTHRDKPCSPEAMDVLMQLAGRTARTPMIWIYSVNDHFWGPTLPRHWHDVFTRAGGVASFVELPPVGDNGHFLLSEPSAFRKPLDAFLANLPGLDIELPRSADAPPPSGYAAIDDATRLPPIDSDDRDGTYRRFLRMDIPRAFAIGPGGAWAARSGPKATAEALEGCQKKKNQPCRLYAVDDQVVWTTP